MQGWRKLDRRAETPKVSWWLAKACQTQPYQHMEQGEDILNTGDDDQYT